MLFHHPCVQLRYVYNDVIYRGGGIASDCSAVVLPSDGADARSTPLATPRGLAVDAGRKRVFVSVADSYAVWAIDVTNATSATAPLWMTAMVGTGVLATNFCPAGTDARACDIAGPEGLAYDAVTDTLFFTTRATASVMLVRAVRNGMVSGAPPLHMLRSGLPLLLRTGAAATAAAALRHTCTTPSEPHTQWQWSMLRVAFALFIDA